MEALSLATIVLAFCTFSHSIQKEKQYEAPNFVISNIVFQPNKFCFPEGAYLEPNNAKFLLQKRRIHLVGSDDLLPSVPCLIVNTCDPDDYRLEKTVFSNLDKLEIINTGCEAIAFEIKEIEIHQKVTDKTYTIKAGNQNAINQIIDSANPFQFYLSIIVNANVNLFDLSNFNENYIKEKYMATGGELLNTTIKDMMDLWDEINIDIITTNKYGEKYSQTLSFSIEENTYCASQSVPEILVNNEVASSNDEAKR